MEENLTSDNEITVNQLVPDIICILALLAGITGYLIHGRKAAAAVSDSINKI